MNNNITTIVTYNVLAQQWLDFKEDYPLVKDYDTIAPWNYRWPLFQKQFKEFQADVLCLQELDKVNYDSYVSEFMKQLGYGSVMQNKQIGNAIFYRESRFQLQLVNERSRAIIVTLKDDDQQTGTGSERGGNCLLTVANVHLEGNPQRPHDRFSQIKSLLAELQKNIKKSGEGSIQEQKIVICGDFNATPQCSIYKLLSQGTILATERDYAVDLPYTNKDYSHPYHFSSAYAHVAGSEPEFTYYCGKSKAHTLDFIWYTSNTLEATQVQDPLIDREHYLDNSLPTFKHPSDHLPAIATLRYLV